MPASTTRSSSAPPPWAACRSVDGRGGGERGASRGLKPSLGVRYRAATRLLLSFHHLHANTHHYQQAGAFKIGDTAGTLDNIIACKLHRPGSVGFVSKSGGMSNEMYNVLARATDGLFEGKSLGMWGGG